MGSSAVCASGPGSVRTSDNSSMRSRLAWVLEPSNRDLPIFEFPLPDGTSLTAVTKNYNLMLTMGPLRDSPRLLE